MGIWRDQPWKRSPNGIPSGLLAFLPSSFPNVFIGNPVSGIINPQLKISGTNPGFPLQPEADPSGRAGDLICEPLKAVWPASLALTIRCDNLLLPLPRRERSEVRVQNRSPLILAFSRKGRRNPLADKMTTPANVKLYESPSRAGGLPTINYSSISGLSSWGKLRLQ